MNKFILTIIIVAIAGVATLIFSLNPGKMPFSKQSVVTSNKQEEFSAETEWSKDEDLKSNQKKGLEIFKPISAMELNKYNIPKYIQDKAGEDPSYFTFDHDRLSEIKEGDHLKFQMLESGINREGIIKAVDQLDDDIIRWSGSFKGYPQDISHFTVTQTKKDRYAIMKVFTENGMYISEIKDGIGLVTPLNEPIDHDGVSVKHDH